MALRAQDDPVSVNLIFWQEVAGEISALGQMDGIVEAALMAKSTISADELTRYLMIKLHKEKRLALSIDKIH